MVTSQRRFKKLIQLILTFASLILAQSTGVAVPERPSETEFRREIGEHRNRVFKMGFAVFENFPQDFPVLNQLPMRERNTILKVYLAIHDLPKLMTLPALKKLSYQAGVTIFDLLYEVYGQQLIDRTLINQLNEAEERLKKAVMDKKFTQWNLASFQVEILKELKRIEFIADITDTKIMRYRELQFIPEDYASARFFDRIGEPDAAVAARWLEDSHYQKAVHSCDRLFF